MTEEIHTLVVDDEESIRFFLREALQEAGHSVVTACSGEEALDRLREAHFDLVMLDLMLGGRVDGLRILELVKWRWPQTLVIILTAHGSLDSAVAAIQEGVDGYLLKPVEPEELWQVVQETMERRERLIEFEKAEEAETVLQQGLFRIDLNKGLASLDGEPLQLTASELDLLTHLIQNAYRVVPPVELVRIMRNQQCDNEAKARQIIKWYIHSLRQKVEPDPSSPRYILTVRGVGYRLVA